MDPLRFEFVLDSAAGGGIRIPFMDTVANDDQPRVLTLPDDLAVANDGAGVREWLS